MHRPGQAINPTRAETMRITSSIIFANAWLKSLLRAYAPARDRGLLLDGLARRPFRKTSATAAPPVARYRRPTEDPPVALFVNRLRELLAAENECVRSRLEREVLTLAVELNAAGIFDVVQVAHPALANMVADHLARQDVPATTLSA